MAKPKPLTPMNNFVYDILLWTFSVLVDLFFREVHPRSSWKIPRKGPVIFVAAPHANQFVDPLILMRVVRTEGHRRISFLIAEKSMKRKFIGWFARSVGAVSVGRALDLTKPAPGKVYLPDPVNDPLLLRGVGTDFEAKDFQAGGLIVLPSVNSTAANAEILEIHGKEEIRLKKPFKGGVAVKQLTGREDVDEKTGEFLNGGSKGPAEGFEGTNFKVAPKVDQTAVYDAVFERLNRGGCVGIFPEGGSHDRTELLPLKAGVAIMALGALAANPDCGLKIVPCGMNYFHAHKFRSRAVIEFGTPVEIEPELVELYKRGERREAVAQLLETVYNALVSVTVTSPDYDTLMLIQAVRRLYNPKGKKLPLPMIVELNRRLVKGYTRYKDDPRIIDLKKSVLAYNKQLMMLNVRDHQVEYARFSVFKVVFTLIYRVGKLILLSAGVLPGLVLFAPVFVAGKTISIKKSREALAASTVKIQARDVVATWKILVSMALAPMLYTFYTVLLTWWTYYNRVQGYMPDYVPLWAVVLFGYMFFPSITYAALRFGETGMDIFKSLRPLVLSLNPSSGNTLVRLRATRADLAAKVTEVINTLGPEMFPDFDNARIVSDPFREDEPGLQTSPRRGRGAFPRTDSDPFGVDTPPQSPGIPQKNEKAASIGGGSSATGHLPRNESFKNLGGIGLFATRPTTPTHHRSRSRTNSGAFHIQGFSSLDSQVNADEVSQKIRGAMRERGQRRRSQGKDGWEVGDEGSGRSGTTTPANEYEFKKEL
ncbi:hypothetical protein W97_08381 [Coniosporium apollinis CBS 100218]|uniref:Phospholipid/glycerol acyltransferase domain-containing protein n=1 Tax=Coniosporium apollinis (strain CBS 100218) TaxID=1168221 RepID=R7Z4P0_CONA1|nr:uncharacterized protein W97_08381 [Coniosporium apollinis CBS 100218]EON69068.1 hypothetical protein W97_08381 [Coniosporium apollinis CBS 100218]